MNQNAPCKLCGKRARLIKRSHIIPDFMYKGLFDDKHRLAMLELKNILKPPKWEQSGIHERYILCEKCESHLSKHETYTSLVLYEGLKDINFENRIGHDGIKTIFISGIDYKKFKLCFLSILWRAHISTHPFFRKVDIPIYEEELRHLIFSEENSSDQEYKISVIGVQGKDGELIRAVVDPVVLPIGDGEVAFFFINGFLYIISLKLASELQISNKSFLSGSGEIEIPILQGKLAYKLFQAFGFPIEFLRLLS